MLDSFQKTALQAADCEVHWDNLTRQLYATDASIYQIEPAAVAFPRNPAQAASVVRQAAKANLSIIPRGAGTGLVGGALGDGLVVEFSRYNRQITKFDPERRNLRVGAGVVLDQLNAFLKPPGLCFGPDVATSSRATLGGMIANNSSGAHVPVYGTTADHVRSLEVVLSDGQIVSIGPEQTTLKSQRQLIDRLVREHAGRIEERMPAGLMKRWPGYGLDRYLRRPGDLNQIIAGSEGTLLAILSAELNLVPLRRRKGLGLVFFASVTEAMQATVELLDLKPAAIEHIDRILFDQTIGQLAFQAARDLLELDAKPCESILLVEFYEDIEERLEGLTRKKLGLRTLPLKESDAMNQVWALRKAGLSLLTGRKGSAKPVTGIEDTAVTPDRLPDYVQALQSLLRSLDLEACFYGHAAAGLLHVRPVLDLHTTEDRRKFRRLADEVAALVKQFKGSLTGEHGVGIARTEYLPEQLGPELLGVMREIKASFDPDNRFNPGKIFDDGRYRIDTNLRWASAENRSLPFTPVLAFAAKDESFVGNLEQCNGCGGCRKETPTMCPTFLATGEEVMSTRGRANIIRAVLEQRHQGTADPLQSEELEAALSNCLSCKACTTECPSNVNLALLKAELLHARHQRQGLSMQERLFSSVDELGRLGCLVPRLANATLHSSWLRRLLQKHLSISAKRPLPAYAPQRFDHWFSHRPFQRRSTGPRVFLWDDTFVRYHDPQIGQAAVKVLEAAGFSVELIRHRRCCGRPAFSQGNLDKAFELGQHNLEQVNRTPQADPILFLEPSCYSMFAEDYRELNLPGAPAAAKRAWLFETFLDHVLEQAPDRLKFNAQEQQVTLHAHCHAKSLLDPRRLSRLAERLPNRSVSLLNTGCCGMAGAFGALEAKYELSLKVAQPLIEQIQAQSPDAAIVASGTSCRHQIEHLTSRQSLHMAELLAGGLSQ